MKVFKNILVPLDGSQAGREALLYALSLAETYQASVWILHVIDLNQYMSSFEQVSGSGYLPQEILDEGQKVLEEVCGLIPAGVTAKTLVKMGRPQERILETAEEMQADLIVMGSRGLGALKQMLMGSVSQHILVHAKSPVLVIR